MLVLLLRHVCPPIMASLVCDMAIVVVICLLLDKNTLLRRLVFVAAVMKGIVVLSARLTLFTSTIALTLFHQHHCTDFVHQHHCTALKLAAQRNNIDAVKRLLEHGADPDIADNVGCLNQLSCLQPMPIGYDT